MLEKYNEGTLDSFTESYNENLFDRLDNGFFEREPEFDSLLEVYVRKKRKCIRTPRIPHNAEFSIVFDYSVIIYHAKAFFNFFPSDSKELKIYTKNIR